MTESVFYTLAVESLGKECNRLNEYTAALDKNPAEKKARIAEYKCAKYRQASVRRIFMLLYHGNRVYQVPAIDLNIENQLKQREDYLSLVENASTDEKIEFKLYYGISAIAEELYSQLQKKLENATDWEKIELEERIGGLRFAIECLDEAWGKRKDVSA